MKIKINILLTSLLVLLCSCADDQATSHYDENDVVVADLLLGVSVPQQGVTRMSQQVTQTNGNNRGLGAVTIVPFAVKRQVEYNDDPKAFIINGIEDQPLTNVYYYPRCSFMKGTASVLCYAKPPKAEGASKAENGSLIFEHDEIMRPSSISFIPDAIYDASASEIPDEAMVIADYLTTIANTSTETTSWQTVKDDVFKAAFQEFIGKGTGLLPGSYPCIKGHAQAVIDYLDKFEFVDAERLELRKAIRENINNIPDDIDTEYPASIGLPDGAAVLRWMGDEFVPQTQRTSIADINAIDRFCYPAELFYYANSRLITKNDSVKLEDYKQAQSWKEILDKYDRDASVNVNTKAVAVVDSLQYGVACLKVVLNPVASALSDSKNNPIDVKSDTKHYFPLTGVVVSGQRDVDFSFMPNANSKYEDFYVYDNQVEAEGVAMDPLHTQSPVYTLLLQSPAALKINLLLEFRNDSGQDFYGKDGGVIYKGTKFYLAGVINPSLKDSYGQTRPQAFTKDEYTTISATIKTLENAYNVMPNLMNPRLEIGVELTPKWTLSTPVNIEFY